MFESIFSTSADSSSSIAFSGLIASLATALALGLISSAAYIFAHKGKALSQSFCHTLVMLPGVICVIILLIGTNIARALSLGGAFAIIRFRSAPGDSKDICFVLFTMAVGLAAGMGYLLYAAAITLVMCAAMLALERFNFGGAKGPEKILKITVPESLNFESAFEEPLVKFTESYKLLKIKTTDLGSLYELSFNVKTKSGASDKDFIDELRARNGNLNISLALDSNESGF